MLSNLGIRIVVAGLVACCVASPALAADLGPFGFFPGLETPSRPAPLDSSDGPVITPEMIDQAARDQHAQEASQRERLGSPKARKDRTSSRSAHRQVSAGKAFALMQDSFGDEIAQLGANPLDRVRGLRVREYRGTHTAVVDTAQGVQLAYSTIPLRVEDADGTPQPVDLALEQVGPFYSPRTPLVPVRVPDNLARSAQVGTHGISVTFDADPSHQESTSVDHKRVFFHDVAADTDLSLGAVSGGLESFTQLRSPASPETFRFHFALPKGTAMRADDKGGLEVVRGETRLLTVPAPSALDAQGESVPATLRVDGDDAIVTVIHRDHDVAYPILLDPVFEDWETSCHGTPPPGKTDLGTCTYNQAWFFGGNLPALSQWSALYGGAAFAFTKAGSSVDWFGQGGQGEGLYVFAYPSNAGYPANSYGEWVWKIADGNTAFIPRAEFGWQNLNRHADYGNDAQIWNGIYNPTTGTYTVKTAVSAAPDGIHDRYDTDIATTNITGGKYAVFALVLPTKRNRPQWTGAYLGGSIIVLDDPDNPTLSQTSYTGVPTGWFDPSQTTTTPSVTATASDPGVGVRAFNVFVPRLGGGSDVATADLGCAGTKESSCPWGSNVSKAIAFSVANAASGVQTLSTVAYDAIGHPSVAGTTSINVDRSKPLITSLTGPVYDHRNQVTDHRSEGIYDTDSSLVITAADGTSSPPTASSSGVKAIDIEVADAGTGTVQQTFLDPNPQGCPQSNCSKSRTWSLHADDYSDGDHTVTVTVKDQLNHATPQSWTITIDRRGDVYHASEVSDDPARGGELISEQWAQAGTTMARSSDEADLTTRNVVTCPSGTSSQTMCGEVRSRLFDQVAGSDDTDDYAVERGTSVTDPRLPYVSDLEKPPPAGSPEATGQLTTVLATWQHAPPAHGDTFDRYHVSQSDPADDGATTVVETNLWLDHRTQLPVKVQTIDGGVSTDIYFDYAADRKNVTEYAANFFSLAPPTNPRSSETTQYRDTTPASEQDRETGATFAPATLGLSDVITGRLFCLSGRQDFAEDNNADLPFSGSSVADAPEAGGPITAHDVNYAVVTSGTCPAGILTPTASTLTISAYARSSTEGLGWQQAYVAAVNAAAPGDDSRVGTKIVTLGGQPTTAYYVPSSPTELAAMAATASTVYTIKGSFGPSDLTQVVSDIKIGLG
jgi:hypothetical protein